MSLNEETRRLIVDWIRDNGLTGDDPSQLSDDENLIETGWLDSIAVLELLVYLEKHTGNKIDLSEADPEDFSTLGGLVRQAVGAAPSAS